jgi:hypothetical protein
MLQCITYIWRTMHICIIAINIKHIPFLSMNRFPPSNRGMNSFPLILSTVKASAKTLSSYFVVFAYIAYNLAQS